jgi:hypothetical protein
MKFSDYSPLFTPRIIGILTLFTVGTIALGIAILKGFNAWNRYCTGWKALTQKFPAADAHKFGGRYKRQIGRFGSGTKRATGGFLIEMAQEGFLATADFARTPILIPWSAIRDITELDMFGLFSSVELVVDYEPRVSFTVPKDALTVIQENVPAERLHKTVFWDAIRSRFQNELPIQPTVTNTKAKNLKL